MNHTIHKRLLIIENRNTYIHTLPASLFWCTQNPVGFFFLKKKPCTFPYGLVTLKTNNCFLHIHPDDKRLNELEVKNCICAAIIIRYCRCHQYKHTHYWPLHFTHTHTHTLCIWGTHLHQPTHTHKVRRNTRSWKTFAKITFQFLLFTFKRKEQSSFSLMSWIGWNKQLPSFWVSPECGTNVSHHRSTLPPNGHFPTFLSLGHIPADLLWKSIHVSRIHFRSFHGDDFYHLYPCFSACCWKFSVLTSWPIESKLRIL